MKDQLELLIEFTKDEDARSRATAIAGLAKIADPRGFAPVLVALFDPADEVRVTAATALGVFADERAIEPLAACLTDPCEQVGVNCVWALGQIPSPRCVHQLIEVSGDAKMPMPVRVAAVTSLGERASNPSSDINHDIELIDAVRSQLLVLFATPDDELRAAAVWTLGHLPHTDDTLAILGKALDDQYEWVVRYAIEALANTGDLRAADYLRGLENDERETVRDLVAEALARLHE